VLVSDVAGLPGCQGGCKTVTATAQAQLPAAVPQPPILGLAPFDGAEDINPLTKPTVTVLDGKITEVSLIDDWGNVVEGEISPDRTSWQPTQRLNFARTYSMTVDSKGNSGVPLSRTTTFDTLSPNNYAHPYLEVQGGFAIQEGQKYGIGTVIAAHFDEPITDKVLAEQNMIVTTSPSVPGSWFWVDDYVAHWRPEHYYTPGTTVSVALNMFGLKLGEGLYGQADAKNTFTIGDAHIGREGMVRPLLHPVDHGARRRGGARAMGAKGISGCPRAVLQGAGGGGMVQMAVGDHDMADRLTRKARKDGLDMGGKVRTRINHRHLASAHHISAGAHERERPRVVSHHTAYVRRDLLKPAIFKAEVADIGNVNGHDASSGRDPTLHADGSCQKGHGRSGRPENAAIPNYI
jgi:hypothetical protein